MSDTKTGWAVASAKAVGLGIASFWFSWSTSYRILVIMMGFELLVSSALFIRRNGLAKWCNVAAAWSIIAKGIIGIIVCSIYLVSDSVTQRTGIPLAEFVALAFSLQQLGYIIKNSKGLDVDAPPIVGIVMGLFQQAITRMGNGIVVDQTSVSPTGEVVSKSTMTIRPEVKEPLVVSPPDSPKSDK